MIKGFQLSMDGFSQGPVGRAVNAVKNSGVGAHVFSVRLSVGRLRSRAHIPQFFAIYQAFAFCSILLHLSQTRCGVGDVQKAAHYKSRNSQSLGLL